jgi:large subunit ribosomal protein L25
VEQFTIEVTKREGKGTPESRRMRKQGLIPSVVYSKGGAATPVKVSYKEFVKVASVSRVSQVFTLKSDVPEINNRPALVKEIQRDYLKNLITHVDFQALREDEEIRVRVPIKVKGEAPGVKTDGGILTIVNREIGVRCLPRAIPGEIGVDVSTLGLNESIHARQVPLPSGVVLTDDPDETIVSVVTVRAIEEEAPAAAAAVTAEGAEGAAAAGAAGAAAPGAAPAAGGAAPAEGAAGAGGKAPAGKAPAGKESGGKEKK